MTRLQIARGVFLTVVGAIVLFVIYSILKRPEAAIPVLTTTPRPLPTARHSRRPVLGMSRRSDDPVANQPTDSVPQSERKATNRVGFTTTELRHRRI